LYPCCFYCFFVDGVIGVACVVVYFTCGVAVCVVVVCLLSVLLLLLYMSLLLFYVVVLAALLYAFFGVCAF